MALSVWLHDVHPFVSVHDLLPQLLATHGLSSHFYFSQPSIILTPPLILFLRPSILACDYTQKEPIRACDGRLRMCSLRWVFIKIGAVLVFPCTKTTIHSVSSLQGPFVLGTMYSVHCDLRFYKEVQLWHLSRSCVCVGHKNKGYFRMFNLLFLTSNLFVGLNRFHMVHIVFVTKYDNTERIKEFNYLLYCKKNSFSFCDFSFSVKLLWFKVLKFSISLHCLYVSRHFCSIWVSFFTTLAFVTSLIIILSKTAI